MKKRILSLLLCLLVCAALLVPASAAQIPYFTDEAGLLSAERGQQLAADLESLSNSLSFDVVVVTLNGLNGLEPEEAAEKIYRDYGFGQNANGDGAILMISMADRDWAMKSFGFGTTALNQDVHTKISNDIVPYLSSGDYETAFRAFADDCVTYVEGAREGNVYKTPFPYVTRFIISLVIALLIALIVVSIMKSKLKTVHQQTQAAEYLVPGSLQVTRADERFLYHTVNRTPRPQQTESRGGGGGGGGSVGSHGKF